MTQYLWVAQESVLVLYRSAGLVWVRPLTVHHRAVHALHLATLHVVGEVLTEVIKLHPTRV